MADETETETEAAAAETPQIADYSIEDLLQVFNLQDPTVFQIKDVANNLIAQMTKNKKLELARFFVAARNKLLAHYTAAAPLLDAEASYNNVISNVWAKNQFSPTDNPELHYYDDDTHFPIEYSEFSKEVQKPKIISTRVVCIDSQFRGNLLPYSSNSLAPSFNTNFTFDLANPINQAVSMRLYSYHLPTTWYAFNQKLGNTFLQYNGEILFVPEGNYTATQLVDTLNAVAAAHPASASLNVSYPDPITGKVSFTNTDTVYAENVGVVLYVKANTANIYSCGETLANLFQTVGINNTLGWLLGFRLTPDPLNGDVKFLLAGGQTLQADVPLDVYGPKYFSLNVEDYNNQRLTSGLTNITYTRSAASLSVPDYYKSTNLECRLQGGALTQKQQYAINAVLQDNQVTNTASGGNTTPGPNSGSAFAVLPLQNIPQVRPQPYFKSGVDVGMFTRKYLTPFRMQRLTVTLTDDKGNLVDLHDNDWSFQLIVEEQIG